jgi:hypothetical protein
MEIPMPPKCPPKLYNYLVKLREAIMTHQPLSGRNSKASPAINKGTTVDVDDCPPPS